MEYSDSLPQPVRILPQANWRGSYDSGAMNGPPLCKNMHFTTDVLPPGFDSGSRNGSTETSWEIYTTHCVEVEWPAQYLWSTKQVRTGYLGPRAWTGSLISESRDASGLYYRRNRFYDPETGQFTQEDPIGLAGGLNLYGFANGDPVSYDDPYGLRAEGCCLEWHYKRNVNNKPVPPTRAAAARINPQWERRPQSENAFHRFGAGNEENVKYMSADGHREAVYSADGRLVTDPTNAGTYNYGTNPVTHTLADGVPYLLFGNGPGDRTTFAQRTGTLVNAVRERLPAAPRTDRRVCVRTGAMCD